MKRNFFKPSILVIVALLVMLGLAGVAKASKPALAVNPTNNSWSALDKAPRFLEEVERAGFDWQEGIFSFYDLIQKSCEKKIFSAMGNNPWPNAYFTLQMPNPEAANYKLPYSLMWQMRQDEAIVLIGQTPPSIRYFSFQSWVQLSPASTADPNNVLANRTLVGSAFGDTVNNLTIHTIGPDPYDRPLVYIITANKQTEQRVSKLVLNAGFPQAVINVEHLSTAITPLGIGPQGSILILGMRNAVPLNQGEYEEYVRRSIDDDLLNGPYRVFRITPPTELPPDPYPVPKLRVRGTGQSELDLYPALKSLERAIIAKEAQRNPALPLKQLTGRFWQDPMANGQFEWIDEPWAGMQIGNYSYLGTRDTNYIQTYPYFKLRSNVDEYVIVYGINHQRTGKATYTSFSVYVEPTFGTGREIGLGTVTDPKYDAGGNPGDSARRYLQPDDPYYQDADMLFAWKIARHCAAEDLPYCLEVGNPVDIDGIPYNDYCDPQINLDIDPSRPDWASDVFVVFRGYMEPATAVAPDSNELVWDRAIYFGPYFSQP
jgi:hypothetical protein